jgi:hypothetical protein
MNAITKRLGLPNILDFLFYTALDATSAASRATGVPAVIGTR